MEDKIILYLDFAPTIIRKAGLDIRYNCVAAEFPCRAFLKESKGAPIAIISDTAA